MTSLSRLIKRSVLISSLLVFTQQLILIPFAARASTSLEIATSISASLSSNRSIIDWLSAIDWMSCAETIMLLSVLISLVSYAVFDAFHQRSSTSSLPWRNPNPIGESMLLGNDSSRDALSPQAAQLRYQRMSKRDVVNGARSVVAA